MCPDYVYSENGRLTGFNQQLAGCPLPICLLGGPYDAITRNDTHILVFDHIYYWIGNTTSKKFTFKQYNRKSPRNLYTTSAFNLKNKFYIIKEDYLYEDNKKLSKDLNYGSIPAVKDIIGNLSSNHIHILKGS